MLYQLSYLGVLPHVGARQEWRLIGAARRLVQTLRNGGSARFPQAKSCAGPRHEYAAVRPAYQWRGIVLEARTMRAIRLFCMSFVAALALPLASASAADLPNMPQAYPALAPSAADVTPNYWSGLYVGTDVSAWGGKGVKGGIGGDAYLGYDHAFDNGVIVGVRASTGYAPFLWSTPSGFTKFTGTDYAGGEAIVGYRMGQVAPYVITGVSLARPTSFGWGFNAGDSLNAVFSGPGAVQAVGEVGMGVTYQVTPNFSMGIEARMYKANNNGGLAPLPW